MECGLWCRPASAPSFLTSAGVNQRMFALKLSAHLFAALMLLPAVTMTIPSSCLRGAFPAHPAVCVCVCGTGSAAVAQELGACGGSRVALLALMFCLRLLLSCLIKHNWEPPSCPETEAPPTRRPMRSSSCGEADEEASRSAKLRLKLGFSFSLSSLVKPGLFLRCSRNKPDLELDLGSFSTLTANRCNPEDTTVCECVCVCVFLSDVLCQDSKGQHEGSLSTL